MSCRLDRNRNGGGIFVYVREDIPTKILTKHNLPENIEGIFLEINFWISKWLLCGICHPPSQNDQDFYYNIDKALDMYCSYEEIVLAVDFHAQEREILPDTFLYKHELHSINKNPRCYKNPNNPSNTDLTLQNCLKFFLKRTQFCQICLIFRN